MFLDLLEDPWTLAGEHGISLSDFADRETPVEVDGRKDLRVVCTYSKAPWFRTRSNKLPPASFPFRSHGEILIYYYLPTPCKEKQEGDLKTALGLGDQVYFLTQTNAVSRYAADESDDDSEEAAVNSWINWSIRLFQEITHEEDEEGDDFSGIARRSWQHVLSQVIKDGGQEAMMSLIVQLTRDRKLRNALVSISKNPRRILERVRENMKVSRIQQLDGACIREYARRPGYDTATKAGPKQELLALNRIERTDTLENRIYVWVLDTIKKFSHKYYQENKTFRSSERVRDVRKFGDDAGRMRNSPAIQDISWEGLIHPVQPNYPLQMDRRYKEVFYAYQKLRHDQKVQDDAWEWQRVLWGCTARLILYSLFQKTLPSYSNSVYVKRESQQGRWLDRCDAPGPFLYNKHRYYLIDCWDLYDEKEWLAENELFPGAYDIGRVGCDSILYSPKETKLLLIWFVYGTDSENDFLDNRLNSCQAAVDRFIVDLKRQRKTLEKVEGLIVASAFRYANPDELLKTVKGPNKPRVSMLLFPKQGNLLMETQKTNVKKVLGSFLK